MEWHLLGVGILRRTAAEHDQLAGGRGRVGVAEGLVVHVTGPQSQVKTEQHEQQDAGGEPQLLHGLHGGRNGRSPSSHWRVGGFRGATERPSHQVERLVQQRLMRRVNLGFSSVRGQFFFEKSLVLVKQRPAAPLALVCPPLGLLLCGQPWGESVKRISHSALVFHFEPFLFQFEMSSNKGWRRNDNAKVHDFFQQRFQEIQNNVSRHFNNQLDGGCLITCEPNPFFKICSLLIKLLWCHR